MSREGENPPRVRQQTPAGKPENLSPNSISHSGALGKSLRPCGLPVPLCARTIPGSQTQRGSIKITDVEGRRPAPSAQGALKERWSTRNFRASASSSGKWGPRRAVSQDTAERADPRNARGGSSVRLRGPGRAGAPASQAKRKKRRILHLLPPSPARTVLTRGYGAGLRRFMPRRLLSRPGCGTLLRDRTGGNPGGKRALKGGGGGGSSGSGGSRCFGTSGSLRPALRPAEA